MTEQTKTIRMTQSQLEALHDFVNIVSDIDSVWERLFDAGLIDPESEGDSPLIQALEALRDE